MLADGWARSFDRARSGALPATLARRRTWATADFAFAAIVFLICLRISLAAVLPLSFDEAYYWLWSKHLAAGYLEHPAAIAFTIRAGTLLFGDTEFGVRFVSLLASVGASWAVWRSAVIFLGDNSAGALASLLFNATLMAAAEGLGATPDSLLIAAAAMLLWSIAELERTQDGRWWFAAGAAAGLAVAAKYTGVFLCASVAGWLLFCASFRQTRRGTQWLWTIWPYAGAMVTLAMFLPTLYWNGLHGFVSFRFQGGRILVDHPGVRYLLEFVGAQAALASPGILVLAAIGSYRIIRFRDGGRSLDLLCFVVWLPLIFFALHSLHDRVQGNWPCFVYPALAILAARTFREIRQRGAPSWPARLIGTSALPIAGIILAVAYIQAFFGVLPMGRSDPIARMIGVGFRPVAAEIAAQAAKIHARAIVTTNYPVTAWLRFYERSPLPVIQISDDDRFLSSPRATGSSLEGNLLYVTQNAKRELSTVRAHFSTAVFSSMIVRSRNGHPIDTFATFTVLGLRGPPSGRLP